MSRLSFSNQPAAWVAFATAALEVGATFGLPVTDAAKAAVAALIVALGAVVTWHQVTPNGRVPAPIVAPPAVAPPPITAAAVLAELATRQAAAATAQADYSTLLEALAGALPPPAA